MKTKEERKKMLDELRDAKCQYPIIGDEGKMHICGKDQMMMCSLPCVKELESGKVEYSDDQSIGVALCEYHAFLAMEIGFGVKTDATLGKCQLFAPFEQIRVIEAVVNNMAMTGKLQEIIKAKEAAEAEAKKAEEALR